MPDTQTPPAPPVDEQTPPPVETPADQPPAEPPAAETEGLGDKGKKALDAMKADRKKAQDEAKQLRDDLSALQAKVEGKEAEHAASQAAQKVKDEALEAANGRILRSAIKTEAKGVLADPTDAYKFLDVDSFEVDANGDVDEAAIAKAIADLIETRPYLAAQGGKKFQGGADGGVRNESSKSVDAQIAEATQAGNFALAIALKQQRQAETASKS